MGHVGSKTRSLGQMLEKPFVGSRGHIFSPKLLLVGQNVCLDYISDRFENGSLGLKTRSPGQILEKPCICSGCHIFSPTLLKISQNVCLYNILDEFENGSC